jgi:uncharacterized membrane protein
MKIIKFLASTVLFGGIFFLCGNFVSAASAEKIDNFDVTVKMNTDASIDITEKIDYDFGDLQRHGIYRNIPIKYKARGGNYILRISNISVSDESGTAYKFDAYNSGDDKIIKIGDADVLLTGKKTYVIGYKIKRAVNYFSDHDELYWNATGNEWTVPIASASAHVIFPENINGSSADIKCFSGPAGSVKSCDSAKYVFTGGNLVGGANFTAKDLLSVDQGLTFVVGIPSGIMHKPTFAEVAIETLKDNWILLVPILVFLYMFRLWWTKGRDPKGRGTIIPEYDVPDNLSPAEVGTIIDEKCGQKEIVAEIINLAVKGYLKIKREEKEILFIKSADYIFEKLKESDGLENQFEMELMNGIFKKGGIIKFSELKGDFYNNYDTAVKNVYASVSAKGYFSKNPKKVIGQYLAALFLLIFIVFNLAAYGGSYLGSLGTYGIFAVIASVIIVILFANVMPQRTYQGVITKEYILGLKEYLTVAEKDRLEFHDAPEKSPEQFEKLLPYAIALGEEKEWAKQFEGINIAHPSWYDDSRGFNNFSAIYLVSSLGDFRSSFSNVAMPPSASSGSSGFGGGGFSGGGFGGGGGGSW